MSFSRIQQLIQSKTFQVIVFLLVFSFTFILRAHNFDRVPPMGHLEELLYGWSGIYLVEEGVPVSWSTLDYPKRAEVSKGLKSYQGGEPIVSVALQKPWLDEPPLFSLLVGWFAHLYGADRNDVLPTSYIRTPVIFISSLTSVMIFMVAKIVSGYWTGILAMLLYGTIPIMVFSSRFAVPENLIALFLMIMVYLLLKFEEKPKFLYLLPIPLLAGLGGLAKPTGYFLLPLALFFAFRKGMLKSCFYLILATIPFIAAFIWYGLYFDAEIFWQLVSIQGFRPVGFSSLGWFFTSPAYDINMLTDSWYIFALLSAAYFIFAPGAGLKKFISLFFVYWVIIVMLSGGEGDLLPWYRFPAFPLLAILGAWGLQFLVKRADFFTTFLTAGLLLGGRHLLANAFRPDALPTTYRLVFSGLMLPSLVRFVFDKDWLEKLCRLVIVGVVVVGIYFNVVYIYNVFELTCESKSCPFGPSTELSSLHFPIIWRWFVLGEPKYR